MISAHYQGASLLHVLVDEHGLERLREATAPSPVSTSVMWQGVPIYRDTCPCSAHIDGSGATDA